jgi:hypothetical protein
MERYTLVYILGTGHCGSTLLDLLLNGHPDIWSVGEVRSLRRLLHGRGPRTRRAPAADRMIELSVPPLLDEAFWQDVERCCTARCGRGLAELELGVPSWAEAIRWTDAEVARWAAENSLLLDCVHRVAGTPMLTDSSKRAQRLYLLDRSGRFDLRVIHLTRDGRAVLSSYMEKGRSFSEGYRLWAGSRLAAPALRRRFRADAWIDVSYEALCDDPRGVLDRLCRFLGVQFTERMAAYRSRAYLGVGGNRMRMADGEDIVLDETWRRRLARSHRIAFDALGGWAERHATRRGRAPKGSDG